MGERHGGRPAIGSRASDRNQPHDHVGRSHLKRTDSQTPSFAVIASPRHLGFLPLKGGGEAGVGPASIDSQSRPPHAANVDSRDQSCLPEKWRRPPPLLPLSGGGILCGSLAFYFRRTVFATTYSHIRSPCMIVWRRHVIPATADGCALSRSCADLASRSLPWLPRCTGRGSTTAGQRGALRRPATPTGDNEV